MLLVFASAKLGSELFERLGQPGIAGEILAGILIGPYVLHWAEPGQILDALAELGVMFLLFQVGLEVKASELLRVGRTAITVAVLGVVAPFALCGGIALLWHQPLVESLFIGAAMVATSVGITARVLAAAGLLDQRASRIILAAAIIDDVLGLIVLDLVSSFAKGKVNYVDLGLVALLASAFVAFAVVYGPRLANRVVPELESRMQGSNSKFILGMILLFGLAALAQYAGVAAIIGAFLSGMALAETVDLKFQTMVNGVTELLVPFFLVGIGLSLNPTVLLHPATALFAGVLFVAAVASKFLGCSLGAWSGGRRDAIRVGVGMIPRGEVGMVVAQLGRTLHVVPDGVYGIIVLLSIATTLVAPPLLKWAYRRTDA